jgi:Raf kinase inhibitor-like YbhB/YbcL family protein
MRNSIIPLLLSAGLFCGMGSANAASKFQIDSTDLNSGKFSELQVLNSFGCSGGNISPQLSWHGEPAGTKSFVVSIYDQDAPTGSGWWHWVVANIPAKVHQLPQGAGGDMSKLPVGALQTNTDMGKPGYSGPCPPVGQTHRYTITVTALKVDQLDVSSESTGAMVGFMSNMNSLGHATKVIKYGR